MKLLPDFDACINRKFRGGSWTLNVTLASMAFASRFSSVACENYSGFRVYQEVR